LVIDRDLKAALLKVGWTSPVLPYSTPIRKAKSSEHTWMTTRGRKLMKGQAYTNEMFDVVCMYVDEHPGCTTRNIGQAVYLKFHTPPSLTHVRLVAWMRNWSRAVLRVLEKEGHVRTERRGHIARYYLIDGELEETNTFH